MATFLTIFFFLQTWSIFALLGRVGVIGFKRIVWCLLAIIPFFWLFALIRIAFFNWPVDTVPKLQVATVDKVTD